MKGRGEEGGRGGGGEGQIRWPGDGPRRGVDDGGVEAGELPARPRPAPVEKPSKSVVDAAVIERPG